MRTRLAALYSLALPTLVSRLHPPDTRWIDKD
ncbi:Uncharacterised protein [Vibrio cholerae]|nr:Uncharacterised protein [Vibrio cholerae]